MSDGIDILIVILAFVVGFAIGVDLPDDEKIKKEKVFKIIKSKTDQNLTKEDFIKLGIAKYNEKTGDFELIYQ